MAKVCLGDVANERKENCKTNEYNDHIVGLEHLIPQEVTLTQWAENIENTFTKVFHKGDVLFGRRRAYLKKAAVAPFDGICSGDITVIEAKPNKIIPELLPFIIQNDNLFDFAVEKSAGSLSPRVKWSHLQNYEFELPDLNEQRELAELLWAAEETRCAYKKIIDANNKIINVFFMKNQKQNINMSFDDIFIDDTKNATKIEKNSYLESGAFWIIDQSQNEIAGYSNRKEGVYRNTPAIIFGDHTRVFKFINEPFFLGADGTKLLKVKNDAVDYTYIYYYLKNLKITNLGYNRHFKLLKDIIFSIPDIRIQKQYASFIEEINKTAKILSVQIENLNNIKKSILEQTFKKEVSHV